MDRKKVSRRKFLEASAVVATAALASACAPAATPAPTPTQAPTVVPTVAPTKPPTAAPTATPAPTKPAIPEGGTITFGTASKNLYSLHPWTTSGSIQIIDMIFNRLVELDYNYDKIMPALAESWEVSKDGLTWTFHLRKDVKWHDGHPFTSRDVVFTYKSLLDPKITGWQPQYLLGVKGAKDYKDGKTKEVGIEALDDYTVKITTEKPVAPMLGNLSAIWIVPEHLLKDADLEKIADNDFFTTPKITGTGAFKLKERKADEYQILERNPDFFRGKPHIETIIQKVIPTEAVAVLAIEKGEVDVIPVRAPDQIAHLKANPNLIVFGHNAPLTQFIEVNVNKPYLSDKRVRQALWYAIDRKTIQKTLYQDAADIANWGVFKSWIPTDDLNTYEYNPDLAKSLLKEAGFPLDQELEIMFYYTDEFHRKMAAAIQQYWQEIGLKIKIRQAEWADIQGDFNAGKWDLLYAGSGAVDPDDLRAHFYSKTTYETAVYKDPELDDLFDKGLVELDEKKRGEIYHDLLKRLNDQAYWIWMWKPKRSWAINKKIKNMEGKLAGVGFHPPVYHGEDTWYLEA